MKVLVGRVGRAHGVTGEVGVVVSTDDPEGRFAPGAVLPTDRDDVPQLVVGSVRRHAGRLLVRFDGIEDRTDAERLAGVGLFADTDDARPSRNPEEYWDHDLTGLTVVDPAGARVGAVVDVRHGPGGDHLVVRLGGGRDALVPFVRAVVPTVDLAAGLVVVDAPEGLWDL